MSRLSTTVKIVGVSWLVACVARLNRHVHQLNADRATFNQRARAASGFAVSISQSKFGRVTTAGTPMITGGTADIDFAERTITLDGATVSTATDRPMTINDIAIEAIARRLEEREQVHTLATANIKGPNGSTGAAA